MSNASISHGHIGRLIFYELDHGDSRDEVVKQLVALGIEPDEARYMVDSACCCRRVALLVEGARHRNLGGAMALGASLLGFYLSASGADPAWWVSALGLALLGGVMYLHGVQQHAEAARIEARHPRRPAVRRPESPAARRATPRSRPRYLQRRGVGLAHHVRPRGERSRLTLMP